MKVLHCIFIGLCGISLNSQVSGKVIHAKTGSPISYVNVWVKSTTKGSTTGPNGEFIIEQGKVGDTLLVSCLGFQNQIVIAKAINEVPLIPAEIFLDEVVVVPMSQVTTREIRSYEKSSRLKNFYFNGHYSLARYFPYSEDYTTTPFIDRLTLVTESALKNVIFRVYLLKADKNGDPSAYPLSEPYLLNCGKGKTEITVNLIDEKIQVPQNGFFVVIDRLNLEQNKFSNKIASDILQPAIAMVKDGALTQTWMSFGGRWLTPEALAKNPGWKDVAINIFLSD